MLAWSGLAVATSVSYHNLKVPEPGFTTLLGELICTVVDPQIPPESASLRNTRSGTLHTRSRREAILTEATKLFAANGFAGVSTEDIGACVGISGPT